MVIIFILNLGRSTEKVEVHSSSSTRSVILLLAGRPTGLGASDFALRTRASRIIVRIASRRMCQYCAPEKWSWSWRHKKGQNRTSIATETWPSLFSSMASNLALYRLRSRVSIQLSSFVPRPESRVELELA